MSVIATAKRRRRQAKMGNTHVAKLGRSVYHKPDEAKARRRQREMLERLARMQHGKSKKK